MGFYRIARHCHNPQAGNMTLHRFITTSSTIPQYKAKSQAAYLTHHPQKATWLRHDMGESKTASLFLICGTNKLTASEPVSNDIVAPGKRLLTASSQFSDCVCHFWY
jgi:hypothetical protein